MILLVIGLFITMFFMMNLIDGFGPSSIVTGRVDPDSTLDTTLFTEIRDALEFLQRWMGKTGIANAKADHAHKGILIDGTATIPGLPGGGVQLAIPDVLLNFGFLPDAILLYNVSATPEAYLWTSNAATTVMGISTTGNDTGEIDHVALGRVSLDSTGNAGQILCFKNTAGFIDVGTYEGDGNPTQTITGIGFQPDLLIIWSDDGLENVIIWATGMAAGHGKRWNVGTHQSSGRIESVNSDGWIVGTDDDVNRLSRTYNYIALKSGLDNSGERLDISTYAGDSSDDRDLLLALGYTPQFALVVETSANGEAPTAKTKTQGFEKGVRWTLGNNLRSNDIQEFTNGSVIVGNDNAVNVTGRTYTILTINGG